MVVTEINTEKINKVIQSMPCFDHRRNDVYSLIPIEMTQEVKPDEAKQMKFGNHIVDRNTIFYETEYSFAFTNIRCVVPGRN